MTRWLTDRAFQIGRHVANVGLVVLGAGGVLSGLAVVYVLMVMFFGGE